MARLSFVLPAMAGLAMSVSTIALAQESGGSWAGAYGGIHLGYGAGSDDNVNTTGQAAGNIANVASGARPASVSMDTDGFVGGVALGYNMQSGNFVYGLEADIDYTDIEDSNTVNTVNPAVAGSPALVNNFKQSLEFLGTLRARLGVAVNGGNTLVYATGGLAYGSIENSVRMSAAAPNTAVTQFSGSTDNTETGYVLGGGLEHAIDANLRLTASYMYYDLGDDTVNVAVVPTAVPLGGGTGYNSEFDTSGHLFRVGVGYKF